MEQTHSEASERLKYQKMWRVPQYRRFSPAEKEAERVLRWLDKHAAKHIIDLGCGSGRLALKIADAGYSVRMIDIAENCLDREVADNLSPSLTFETGCAWSTDVWRMRADAVICIDMLEHIPPEFVDDVVLNLHCMAPHGYVNAALYKDGFGQRIRERLHLTIQPAHWWHAKFPDAENTVRGNDAWMIW